MRTVTKTVCSAFLDTSSLGCTQSLVGTVVACAPGKGRILSYGAQRGDNKRRVYVQSGLLGREKLKL